MYRYNELDSQLVNQRVAQIRDQVRRFCEREIAPHPAAWEEAHGVPRSV